MAWPTPAQVINAAGQELGLISWASPVSDPFASTDKNVLLMAALLQKEGQDLARRYAWTQLQIEGALTLMSGVSSYSLPGGFLRFISQTEWNRSAMLPVPSVGPQDWQMLQARTAGGLTSKVMRVYGNAVHFYETPTASESVYVEYQTAYWIRAAITAWANNTAYTAGAVRSNAGLVYTCTTGGTSAVLPATGPSGTGTGITDGTCVWAYSYPSVYAAPPTNETSDTSTDYLFYDFRLLVDALKLAFRRHKGLDTTADQQDFDASLQAALGADFLAPVLSLTPSGGATLLGPGNAPEGGYG